MMVILIKKMMNDDRQRLGGIMVGGYGIGDDDICSNGSIIK